MNKKTMAKIFEEIIKNGPYPIRFPDADSLDQDEEWCEVKIDGKWERIRFHDYNDIYNIPGLYETIFYRTLGTNSPYRMSEFLDSILKEKEIKPQDLRVIDFGAGNGMSGEALQNIGVRTIVGCDLLEEAKKANWRDRPWVYADYFAGDITNLSKSDFNQLQEYKFNCLLTVAALGFGDIPPEAFYQAYNLVEEGGLICFNIRDEFLKLKNRKGFSALIHSMLQDETMEIELYRRYQHRFNVHGEPLYYVGIVATKHRHLTEDDLNKIK
jgi:SAM-dependent methyltransferase